MSNSKDISSQGLSPESDKELIALAKKGDSDAFKKLVMMNERRFLNLAYSLNRNPDVAREIVQESLLKAWKNIGSFKGQSSFYTWVYRIISNMTIDYSRKRYRQRERAVGEAEVLDAGLQKSSGQGGIPMGNVVSPDKSYESMELGKHLRKAINSLSHEHREVILLREVEGLSYAEISEAVGCSRGTVMSRLHHARKKLQNFLKEISSEFIVMERATVSALDAAAKKG
jgi:RNA polymerase sigma-70 factor (ECF subfamily)